MKLIQLSISVVALFCAQTSLAARPNYTYLGAGYVYDRLNGGCEQDGLFLEGSLVINELSFVRIEHTDVTSSSWCGSTTTSVGGGVRGDIGGSSSVYAAAALVHRDYGVVSETGVGVDAGVRSLVRPELEARGLVGYEALGDIETTYFGAGVDYWLSPFITLNAAITFNDHEDAGIKAGLRYNF